MKREEQFSKGECECDGWMYRAYNRADRLIDFEVEKPGGYSIPETLFKMYSLSKHSLDALQNSYLYATHPNQLNDIFDCHAGLVEFDDLNLIKEFFGSEYDEKDLIKKFVERDEALFHRTAVNFKEIFYRYYGIISLTDNPNNIQMWSYYNNHEGFLVELVTEGLDGAYNGPFPINYQDKAKPVKISEARSSALIYQCGIKHIDWQHEKEWRLFVSSREPMESKGFKKLEEIGGLPREFKYKKEIIRSIALGNKFFTFEEKKQISNRDLEINLDKTQESKYALKKELLECLYEMEVMLLMCLDKTPFILQFAEYKIVDRKEDQFILRMIPNGVE